VNPPLVLTTQLRSVLSDILNPVNHRSRRGFKADIGGIHNLDVPAWIISRPLDPSGPDRHAVLTLRTDSFLQLRIARVHSVIGCPTERVDSDRPVRIDATANKPVPTDEIMAVE